MNTSNQSFTDFKPHWTDIFANLYPLGVRVILYILFFLDTCITFITAALLCKEWHSSSYSEKLWLSVNAVLLTIASLTRMFFVRKSKIRCIITVTICARIKIIIPQLLVVIWCFVHKYFYGNTSTTVHKWMQAVVIYGYVFAALTLFELAIIFFLIGCHLSVYYSSPPVSELLDEPLFRLPYTPELLKENDECFICLERFSPSETVIYLPCEEFHHFHEKCILAWMRRNSSCPICKREITEQLLNQAEVNVDALKRHFLTQRNLMSQGNAEIIPNEIFISK